MLQESSTIHRIDVTGERAMGNRTKLRRLVACEPLDSRILLASFPASEFSSPIGNQRYSLADNVGTSDSVNRESVRTFYNGKPALETILATVINSQTTYQYS